MVEPRGLAIPADAVLRGRRSATEATLTRTLTWNLVPRD